MAGVCILIFRALTALSGILALAVVTQRYYLAYRGAYLSFEIYMWVMTIGTSIASTFFIQDLFGMMRAGLGPLLDKIFYVANCLASLLVAVYGLLTFFKKDIDSNIFVSWFFAALFSLLSAITSCLLCGCQPKMQNDNDA